MPHPHTELIPPTQEVNGILIVPDNPATLQAAGVTAVYRAPRPTERQLAALDAVSSSGDTTPREQDDALEAATHYGATSVAHATGVALSRGDLSPLDVNPPRVGKQPALLQAVLGRAATGQADREIYGALGHRMPRNMPLSDFYERLFAYLGVGNLPTAVRAAASLGMVSLIRQRFVLALTHPLPELTDEHVDLFRRRIAGAKVADLAKLYHCSTTTVKGHVSRVIALTEGKTSAGTNTKLLIAGILPFTFEPGPSLVEDRDVRMLALRACGVSEEGAASQVGLTKPALKTRLVVVHPAMNVVNFTQVPLRGLERSIFLRGEAQTDSSVATRSVGL